MLKTIYLHFRLDVNTLLLIYARPGARRPPALAPARSGARPPARRPPPTAAADRRRPPGRSPDTPKDDFWGSLSFFRIVKTLFLMTNGLKYLIKPKHLKTIPTSLNIKPKNPK